MYVIMIVIIVYASLILSLIRSLSDDPEVTYSGWNSEIS